MRVWVEGWVGSGRGIYLEEGGSRREREGVLHRSGFLL